MIDSRSGTGRIDHNVHVYVPDADQYREVLTRAVPRCPSWCAEGQGHPFSGLTTAEATRADPAVPPEMPFRVHVRPHEHVDNVAVHVVEVARHEGHGEPFRRPPVIVCRPIPYGDEY